MVLAVGVFIGTKFLNKAEPVEEVSGPVIAEAIMKTINLEEIAKHAVPTDCWVAIEGKVYDVSKFVPAHPGGEAIHQGCGKDATSMFNSRPNLGTSHSDRARKILSQYQIGELAK